MDAGAQHILEEAGQSGILDKAGDLTAEQRKELFEQVVYLNSKYPGGLKEYVARAKKLLYESANNINPFQGFSPSVPSGAVIDYASNEQIHSLEKEGMHEMQKCGFVLVAGGLGERLGYSSIKIGLPLSMLEPKYCYLQYYIDYILAFSERVGTALPLCIMTSEDTHSRTIDLLQANQYFGFPKDKLSLVKQEKVPALIDNQAHFCFCKGDQSHLLETKPHGHGDIHTLLHQNGVVQKWRQEGLKWFVIFQDTNALVFKVIPSVLGYSAQQDFALNSITINRKPGEAVGGICRLTKSEGEEVKEQLTVNVEYNQLDPLLRAKWNKDGDVPNEQGFSHFPGNINVLVFQINQYLEALNKTGGLVPEFVNPKYADETKTVFKSPTRLECMMQDFPRLFPPSAKVGFTSYPRWACFSAAKNSVAEAEVKAAKGLSPESCSSAETDFYEINRRFLEMSGVKVERATACKFGGIALELMPAVMIKPSFGVTLKEYQTKCEGNNSIGPEGGLILEGKTTQLKDKEVKSGVQRLTGEGSSTVAEGIKFVELKSGEDYEEVWKIRNYYLELK